ncbi:MAG TPA: cation transporting ATPase C-terminal domain-containing protein, partial [Anaerolineae bacterium]|nr:cation transporting ATPase C-terminal domain-containing protein [Anaerolineae bacterium]
LLATGAGELLAITTTIFAGLPLIFLPAQILWVNLVTNGLQDVALAFEPKEIGVEERPPRSPGEGILNRTLWIRLGIIGVIIGVASLGIFISALLIGAEVAHARTLAVTTIVFAQFFHVFNSRSERAPVFRQRPTENRFLFFSMIIAFVAQMAFIYVPAMQTIFRTTALNITELLLTAVIASTVLIGSELDKWRLRARDARA